MIFLKSAFLVVKNNNINNNNENLRHYPPQPKARNNFIDSKLAIKLQQKHIQKYRKLMSGSTLKYQMSVREAMQDARRFFVF
jgi:hypothetical protein